MMAKGQTIKCLVLARDYPDKTSKGMMYVHVRNMYYVKNGINVTVLNFGAKDNYEFEGINVIAEKNYDNNEKYDLLICHAPNLKNHYRFVRKHGADFKKILMVYHGHEILRISEEYPREYEWKKNKVPLFLHDCYDSLKFKLWRNELIIIQDKVNLVFVSNWLYSRFKKNLKIDDSILKDRAFVIHNSVGKIFETEKYNKSSKKKYDFITIRGSAIDKSKYGIDVVYNLARRNPGFSFLVIGKGEFFQHYGKLPNLTVIPKVLGHEEMLQYLDESRCALLPTKEDTQGVMACEMAAYGIPLITSDIEICREIFAKQKNVFLIDNDEDVDLGPYLKKIEGFKVIKDKTYCEHDTVRNEVKLIKEICHE